MITFRNDSSDHLFSEFYTIYNQHEEMTDNDGEFQIVSDINACWARCFNCNEPFESNLPVKAIWYNKDKADELQLTTEERFACIAHELGHLFDGSRGEDQQDREKRADEFAANLGLAEHLITALEKLKSFNEKLIQTRIDILRNLQ